MQQPTIDPKDREWTDAKTGNPCKAVCVSYYNGDARKRKQFGYGKKGVTRKDAVVKANKFIRDLIVDTENGVRIDNADVCALALAAKEYLKDYGTRNAITSLEQREGDMKNHILEHIKVKFVSDIDKVVVEKWHKALKEKGCSDDKITRVKTCLTQMIDYAIRQGWAKVNWASVFKAAKDGRHKQMEKKEKGRFGAVRIIGLNEIPSPEEMKAILEAATKKAHWYYVFLLVSFSTAIRTGEARGLHREDVLFPEMLDADNLHEYPNGCLRITCSANDKGHVVPPKTHAGIRLAPMPEKVANALREHLASHNHKYVFPNTAGHIYCPSTLRDDFWRPTLEAAGLTDGTITRTITKGRINKTKETIVLAKAKYVPYSTRHFAISYFIMRKIPLKEIATMVGHKDEALTRRVYQHLFPKQKRAASVAMNDAMDDLLTASPNLALPAAE